ncbi:MAG: VWA domain-containing protein [Candidatus Riflebacteria bacterium]|nr:VWA domain-containing protein [Candidatus Riflebacteria bacterium]
MVEVNPRTAPIRIKYWHYILFLALLTLLALAVLWSLLDTQWGASSSYSEFFRRYLSSVNKFRPSAKPEDNLSNALRIHGVEQVGDKRYVLLFSATDDKGEPIVSFPSADITVSVGQASAALTPAIVDHVTPINQMAAWNEKVSFAGIMDYSGSMFQEDIRNIESNYSSFISGILFPFNAAIYKFHSDVLETLALSSDKKAIENAVMTTVALGGATALYEAMDKGITAIQARPHLRFLLLTTDGNNNAGSVDLPSVLRRSRQHFISTFVFGFGWLNVQTLKQITEDTDGYYVYVPDSKDLKSWFPKLAKIVNNVQVVEFSPSANLTMPPSVELTVKVNGTILKRTR